MIVISRKKENLRSPFYKYKSVAEKQIKQIKSRTVAKVAA